MEEPFLNLSGEAAQRLATEDERPHVNEGTRSTDAIPSAKPAKPPAMPLPRNVRGRRY